MQTAETNRGSTAPAHLIETVKANGRSLDIAWQDGHHSTFHNIWLRDNCSCDSCGDHSGGARFFEIKDIPSDLTTAASVDEDGRLRLDWAADGHTTYYDTSWLRSHCYSASERGKRRHNPITWDASIAGKLPEADYAKTQTDEVERLKVHDAVRTYGICLLRHVPATREATEEVAGTFGFVRRTHYGRIFEIMSTPNPTIIANAPVPLRPHTDENFREPPPGIMIFHTIRASEDGGGVSVMTDGFKLLEDFKALYPAEFDLLTKLPVPHRRFIEGVGLRAEAPIIQLDHYGQVCEFRLNERTMGPLDLPHDEMEAAYAAIGKMLELSYQSKYHMHHLLMDGEALIFDNARVMHARTGFNGNRHVRLTHIGSDEFYSRWRQLRNQLHGDINLI